ncbi:MAG: MarR family transcriptional regulator [Fusobacteriaceae bacterium]|nr:MarR family transcriptional regulator [Fusobacteriaceae bacterium]MBN2838546.1 MarR family transcriptional regulator [Fusobacteriaceae bacterium]
MDKYDVLKLDNQFCFSVYALSKEITKLYKPFLKKLDLTYTQYITMLVLWEEDHITVNAIGKKLALDSGTLTPLLKKLEEKELIIRQRKKDDERNVNIFLSEKGKKLKDKAVEVPFKLIEQIQIDPLKIIELKNAIQEINAKLMRE